MQWHSEMVELKQNCFHECSCIIGYPYMYKQGWVMNIFLRQIVFPIAGSVVLFFGCSVGVQVEADKAYVDFDEGKYAKIPFRYPSSLTIEDIREIIGILKSSTNDEILYVSILSGRYPKTLSVPTCKSGERLANTCDKGNQYQFVTSDCGWVLSMFLPNSWQT